MALCGLQYHWCLGKGEWYLSTFGGIIWETHILWVTGRWAMTWDITVVVLSLKQISTTCTFIFEHALVSAHYYEGKMHQICNLFCFSNVPQHCNTWGNLLCVCISCTILFDIKCTGFRTKSSSLLMLLLMMTWSRQWYALLFMDSCIPLYRWCWKASAHCKWWMRKVIEVLLIASFEVLWNIKW